MEEIPALKLEGPLLRNLRDSLLNAFPDYQAMSQMVSFQLEVRLASIVAPGDMNAVAFGLIEWAKTQGRGEELIVKAHRESPTNPMLRAFVAEHLPSALVAAPAWSAPQLPLQAPPKFGAADETLTAADERGTRAMAGARLRPDTIFKAFQQQVRREIERRVGRKYLPELFQPRPIEDDIRAFIELDLDQSQLEELKNEVRHIVVPKLPDGVAEEWASAVQALVEATGWAEVEPELERLNSVADELTKSVLQELSARIRSFRRNTFLIKDRAGSGKTTLLCHAALHHGVGVVTMFLSCKFDLPRSGSLKEVIAAAIRTEIEAQLAPGDNQYALPTDSDRLIREVAAAIKDAGMQLVIFLDGINENRDLRALDEALTAAFANLNSLPIKFVVTCRDIFWEFFDSKQWSRFLYKREIFDLPGFEGKVVDTAIEGYFRAYQITGHLRGDARKQCRHPLLLRFFCEAYRNRNVRSIKDLRLKDLFDVYWCRKRQEIAEALGFGSAGGWRIEAFLFGLLDYMEQELTSRVRVGDIPRVTGDSDIDSDKSLYRHLLDQDIIIEEQPPSQAFDATYHSRRVSFVYDEFYDYVMAVNYVRKHMWDQKNVGEVTLDILDLLEKSQRFEQARGIIEYLVLLSESKGMHRVQCAALARLGSYEILCNLLPKLRENTDWAIEVLRWCLLTCDKQASGKGNADHSLARTAELIRDCDQEELYDKLLTSAPIQISRQVEPQERGDAETKEPVLVLDSLMRTVFNSVLQPPIFITYERAGQTSHWRLHDYLWRLRQLDMSYLQSPDNLANNAIDAAARCIKSLFSSEHEKAWEVIKAWTLEGGILALTSNYLIGMNESYTAMFSETETYQQLGLWLLSDDERDQEAAARLLSQFSVVHLSTAATDWSETTVTKASSTISRAFRQVFMREPDRALKVLAGWVKEGTGKYDDLIAEVLEQASPPESMALDIYRRWEMQLVSMKAGVRAPRTSQSINNFINRLRVVRSRANNKYAPGAGKKKYFLNKRSKRH
ncbi:MAG TPA: effector-associated domain EAD1-containing protein [Pyrinomonadaceae bacterium]|nr:effector-associated domain EAD1-containing protein [Pyrinomonadaceae bacterium]